MNYTISELINILQKHPNQNAEVIPILNIISPENEDFDTVCELDIQNLSNELDFYEDFVELLITTNKTPADVDYCIHDFLENYDEINIEINKDSGILITDNQENVLREIDLDFENIQKYNFSVATEIVKKLQQLL